MIKLNKLIKILVVLLFSLNSSTVNSQSDDVSSEERVGQAGAYELLINPWARSSGLASSNTASVRGIESVFMNVAGLTGNKLNASNVFTCFVVCRHFN